MTSTPAPPRRRAAWPAPPDSVLVLGGALTAGGLASVAPWEVGVSVALVVLLLVASHRLAPAVAIGALLIACVGALRAAARVSAHERRAAQADQAMPAPVRCTGRGRVASSPVRTHDVLRYDAELQDLACEGRDVAWAGAVSLYGGPADLARGDDVEVVATLAPPQRLWNPSGGDPRPGEAHRGILRSGGTLDVRVLRRGPSILAAVDRVRARVRDRIDATFAPDLAPMARALVLGESDLAPGDDQSFRVSGLSHLLAVSGMHLVLVIGLATRSLQALLARVPAVAARFDVGRIVAGIGLPAAWLYAETAGFGGSTVRAAWMASAVLASRCIGRRSSAPRAFGLSLGTMAALDPLVALDLSFLLSAAATGGLLAFARPLGDRLASWVPPRAEPVVRAAATTIAASLPCAPILARFAPSFPIGGIPANLLAVPLGECAALPLCLLHGLLAWWPAAELGTARIASGALVLVRLVARAFSSPLLTADLPRPTSWQLVALALGFASPWLAPRLRRAVASAVVVAAVLLELQARRAGAPTGLLRATFLDVGQGDAAIVDLPDGTAVVVDGGGLVGSPIDVGARVLAPELRARRRKGVAAVVLSHPHPDHFGGLVAGLEGVAVAQVWDTGQGEAEGVGGAYGLLLDASRSRGTPILRPAQLCGTRSLGGATFEVLAPCPAYAPERGPNDNSFVLRITFGSRALLLVGDAEHEEERLLLAGPRETLRADVLKVGHHGSRTSSTPGFVSTVAPSEAIVSAGRRNRFGHPSPDTLSTLERAGCRVWRTDRDGAVVVETDGASLEVRSAPSW